MTPTRPVVFSGYDPASIALMVDILRRASQNKAIDMAGLEVALLDVVYATGIGREDTDEAAWWHDGEKDSHLEMARQFASMADAPNPLDSSVCTAALQPEMNGMIYNRWAVRWRREGRDQDPSIRVIEWASMTSSEQEEIRTMARSLAAYHHALAPAWRPRKDTIDTLLLLMAEIFVRYTLDDGHHLKLPHSTGSRFIMFAHEALKPFYDPSEIGTTPLGRRWGRMKQEALKAS